MKTDDILKTVAKYDTPTMCNAMEHILGTRTAIGFTRSQVVCTVSVKSVIVGFAKTAKIRAASPPLLTSEQVDENREKYYDYIVADEKNPLVVIEDTDYPNSIGAFWGELNVAIHNGLGINGSLTNGLIRDLDMLDYGYQVIAGGVGPSHAYVHVTEINTAVNIFGLQVSPGDFIHADRHGAMTVPIKHLAAMPDALEFVTKRETPILSAARQKDFSLEKLKQAISASKKIV